MSDDWDTVTILKKKPLKAAQMKTESAINQARESKMTLASLERKMSTISLFVSFLNNRTTRPGGGDSSEM